MVFFMSPNLMDSDRCILLIENAHGHDRTHPSERPSRVWGSLSNRVDLIYPDRGILFIGTHKLMTEVIPLNTFVCSGVLFAFSLQI